MYFPYKNNWISISKFYKTNQHLLKFFLTIFLVKDLHTGMILTSDLNNNGVYEMPSLVHISQTQPLAMVGIGASSFD